VSLVVSGVDDAVACRRLHGAELREIVGEAGVTTGSVCMRRWYVAFTAGARVREVLRTGRSAAQLPAVGDH